MKKPSTRISELKDNEIRLGGIIDGERVYKIVQVRRVSLYYRDYDKKILIPNIPHTTIENFAKGYGFDALTSYNYYDWHEKKRITKRLPQNGWLHKTVENPR